MIVWIVRHGKAEERSPSGADFDRPLRGRGQRQAQWLGEQLARRENPPRLLVSSRTARARRTAELVAHALGLEVRFDDRLLVDEPAGPVIDLLGELASAPGAGGVALFGHNPTLSILAGALTGRHVSLRTGEAAAVELAGEVEPGAGRLVEMLRLEE